MDAPSWQACLVMLQMLNLGFKTKPDHHEQVHGSGVGAKTT